MKKKAGEVSSTDSFPEETCLPMPDFEAKWQREPVHLLTPWKVSATGGAWSRSWHFAWLPASGGPFSRGAFFFRMGRGPSGCGTSQPLWRTLSHLSWWIQRRWRKDSFFFQLEGMEEFFFVLVNCFFFWDVSLKIYWNTIGVQRLMVFWNKVILWRWEQLQPDLQGLCQWSGNGTQMDHFLRPASVLAIAPLERCGKLERWNDICNSIDAVVFLKRNAGLFPLYRL